MAERPPLAHTWGPPDDGIRYCTLCGYAEGCDPDCSGAHGKRVAEQDDVLIEALAQAFAHDFGKRMLVLEEDYGRARLAADVVKRLAADG